MKYRIIQDVNGKYQAQKRVRKFGAFGVPNHAWADFGTPSYVFEWVEEEIRTKQAIDRRIEAAKNGPTVIKEYD